MIVRLDKFISSTLIISRKDANALIKKGRITVDGKVSKSADLKVDTDNNKIVYDGKTLSYNEYIYIMLNKPKGLVCSSDDKRDNTVMSLFPSEYTDKNISCVGRLDKDTTGLLLVTNDGPLAHKLLSPKHHAKKKYLVTCDKPFIEDDIKTMEKGIVIEGKNTAPALLEIIDDDKYSAFVTLTDGKFHEVKRLCYECGQKEVLSLHRTEFASLSLDSTLQEGKWRILNENEVSLLKTDKV